MAGITAALGGLGTGGIGASVGGTSRVFASLNFKTGCNVSWNSATELAIGAGEFVPENVFGSRMYRIAADTTIDATDLTGAADSWWAVVAWVDPSKAFDDVSVTVHVFTAGATLSGFTPPTGYTLGRILALVRADTSDEYVQFGGRVDGSIWVCNYSNPDVFGAVAAGSDWNLFQGDPARYDAGVGSWTSVDCTSGCPPDSRAQARLLLTGGTGGVPGFMFEKGDPGVYRTSTGGPTQETVGWVTVDNNGTIWVAKENSGSASSVTVKHSNYFRVLC